eukprot:Sspe_Gene.102540::Locus_78153_Transcript_1_1_Confidence_1.000_Length_1099::g.102540::m.102540
MGLRPLSIASAIYRAWASARVGLAMRWQDGWCHPSLRGFRRGACAEEVSWCLALRVELARRGKGRGVLHGVEFDLAKAFDSIPWNIIYRLAEVRGMAPGVLGALEAAGRGMRRRFRVGPSLGEGMTPANGVMQGCPLSPILMNLVMTEWARLVERRVDGAVPGGFADDVHALAEEVRTVQQVCDTTGEYFTDLGMTLKAEKCEAFSTARKVPTV